MQEIIPAHKDIFEKLRTEIRYRHYSIRTEKTYEQWIRRFLHFHKTKSVDHISAADIRSYLDYLAVRSPVD